MGARDEARGGPRADRQPTAAPGGKGKFASRPRRDGSVPLDAFVSRAEGERGRQRKQERQRARRERAVETPLRRSPGGGPADPRRSRPSAGFEPDRARERRTDPAPIVETPAPTGVQHVTVDADRAGQRIDNFLLRQLKGVPKTHVYRLLRTGQVRVNGKRAKPMQKLAEGDQLRIPPVRLPEAGEVVQASERSLEQLSAQVIHEDARYLAIDKPSGMASHGGSGISLGAIEMMRQLRPDETLELVHRLDRDTSGVLLFARRASALRAVQSEMRAGHIRKRYLALLAGHLPKASVVVDVPLTKSVLQGGERMVQVDELGKPSRSTFKLLQRFADADFVEVLIDTGRTHQIRVHAQHLGAPVAGDPKYGDAEANKRLKSAGLNRLFLHAAEMRFRIEEHGEVLLSAPLPAALQKVLDALA